MMRPAKRILGFTCAAVLAAAGGAVAQHHGGQGGGHGCRHGCAGMASQDAGTHSADMQVFHELFANRGKIRRTVEHLPNGISTETVSDDPAVARLLQAHVRAMVARLDENRPIHVRDPLFAELFRNARHVKVRIEPLSAGVRVIETSGDAYTVTLLREHARVVGLFIENGMSEMRRDHPVPAR